MVKTEERLNLDALAYNMKRLYNLIQGESISTTHQLKLDVNIYWDSHSKISFGGHTIIDKINKHTMNLSKPNNNAKTEINLLKEEINSIKEIDSKTKDHILLELQFKINY